MKKSSSSLRSSGKGLGVLILAAGEGTRMNSALPKVLHPVAGKPMLFHGIRLANALKPSAIGVVVRHQADEVQARIEAMTKGWLSRPLVFVRQKGPTGSGGAVIDAIPFLKRFQTAVVMCGDTPLLSFETVYQLLNSHREQKGQVTLLTARLANPRGYGRVVRSPMGEVLKIVEESEAGPKEAAINEINSGTYCFEVPQLLEAVKELKPQGPKREQYLTTALELVRQKGGRVNASTASNPEEALGINTRVQLAHVERVLNRRTLDRLMLAGVTVVDPLHTYVGPDVEVGQDTVLLPGTILEGKTSIGKGCVIGPFTHIADSSVGNACEVRSSFVRESRLLEKTTVGPFAHVRPGTVAGPRARIGNFSETKAARIGMGAKVPHLSYIGDAEIGDDVNIGAGTITCNYDGVEKHKTVIGPKAFVGSNVNLVAPVKVGRGAKIGAGSTITDDVPEGALAIARARQENKRR